jgi:hypothetical protein
MMSIGIDRIFMFFGDILIICCLHMNINMLCNGLANDHTQQASSTLIDSVLGLFVLNEIMTNLIMDLATMLLRHYIKILNAHATMLYMRIRPPANEPDTTYTKIRHETK